MRIGGEESGGRMMRRVEGTWEIMCGMGGEGAVGGGGGSGGKMRGFGEDEGMKG